ncbi:hypothetical protein D5b_00074 [Faustovirus]|nr:hypothetical protein D5b_00074 [Faustovirus]AMN84836.1 hypothetical protein D6_00436 [Faustovirus]AMP44032.1 hypothetical protein PRJ_Dakar_00073 [Faustovirus]QKE50519.1 hypothetical protein F-VV10_0399 [Faustovirus]
MNNHSEYTPEQLAEFEAKKKELIEWLEQQDYEIVETPIKAPPRPKKMKIEWPAFCLIL